MINVVGIYEAEVTSCVQRTYTSW